MGLLIDIGIAKTNKYASRESGDTVEVIERPTGGFSIVLADGQGSGRAAKSLSQFVCARAVTMLKDGVREEAAARGAQDALYAYRHGQVSATLDIISVDLRDQQLVVARYAELPLLLSTAGMHEALPAGGVPAGRYPLAEPVVVHRPLTSGLRVIVVSDGVAHAGRRCGGAPIDLAAWAQTRQPCDAQGIADALLQTVISLDQDKPGDDMTAAVIQIERHDESRHLVRRLNLQVPIP